MKVIILFSIFISSFCFASDNSTTELFNKAISQKAQLYKYLEGRKFKQRHYVRKIFSYPQDKKQIERFYADYRSLINFKNYMNFIVPETRFQRKVNEIFKDDLSTQFESKIKAIKASSKKIVVAPKTIIKEVKAKPIVKEIRTVIKEEAKSKSWIWLLAGGFIVLAVVFLELLIWRRLESRVKLMAKKVFHLRLEKKCFKISKDQNFYLVKNGKVLQKFSRGNIELADADSIDDIQSFITNESFADRPRFEAIELRIDGKHKIIDIRKIDESSKNEAILIEANERLKSFDENFKYELMLKDHGQSINIERRGHIVYMDDSLDPIIRNIVDLAEVLSSDFKNVEYAVEGEKEFIKVEMFLKTGRDQLGEINALYNFETWTLLAQLEDAFKSHALNIEVFKIYTKDHFEGLQVECRFKHQKEARASIETNQREIIGGMSV